MKIKVNELIDFEKLAFGDVFKYMSDYFLVVEVSGDEGVEKCAVCLTNNEYDVQSFNNEKVERKTATLIIE